MIERKGQKEEVMNQLNQEISEYQLENLEIPDQLKNLENHLVVMNQEKRKLEKEIHSIIKVR
jgi:chromosome segregation ATPase